MSNKILVVAPEFPLPANHGGKVDVIRRLETLKKLGYKVDIIFTSYMDESKIDFQLLDKYVEECYYAKRNSKVHHIFNFKPLQVLSRINLREINLKTNYSTVILEGDYVGEILNNNTLKSQNYILRVNNIEYKYFAELAKSTFPHYKCLYYVLDSIKFYFYSKNLYKNVNKLAFVSIEEKNVIKKKYPNIKSELLLSHFDIEKFKIQSLISNNVLFVGSLFMPNNLKGLLWYLNNVHDELCKINENYNLIIAGSTNDSCIEIKEILNKYMRVTTYFNLNDLSDIYAQSSVFINPMLEGAGIKVKTINAIQNGLPIVSTNVGFEGIGLEHQKHLLVANSKTEFVNCVSNLLNDRSLSLAIVKSSQNYLREINHEQVLQDLLKI